MNGKRLTDEQIRDEAVNHIKTDGSVDLQAMATVLKVHQVTLYNRVLAMRADGTWKYPKGKRQSSKPPTKPCDLCGKGTGKFGGEPFDLEGKICTRCWRELTEEALMKEAG